MQRYNPPGEAQKKSLHSILRVDSFIEGTIDREFIAKAFFLPKEVLGSGRWKIDNIYVCSGEEWQKMHTQFKRHGASIAYDPNSEEIINAARYVGVSVRRHHLTGETFVVVKLWYGDGTQHQMFAPRKDVKIVRQKPPIAALEKRGE